MAVDPALERPSVEEAIARIEARNGDLRAVLHPMFDEARRQAAARRAEAPRSALHGVPYVLKDVWDVAGVPTTGGSWRHRDRVPERSSTIHAALEEAGAVLVGRSNLSDLALSPESDNCMLGPTRNPLDLSRTSGGSSGGAAAAVADGMAAFDWGSDFGGSIRMPAGFCGVAGIRLSSSVWPSGEHFPTLPTPLARLNGMGPIARTVAGCRAVLGAVAAKLRTGSAPAFETRGVAIWAPDGWTRGRWATFARDAAQAIRQAGHDAVRADLPAPRRVGLAFDALVSSHFDAFVQTGELPFWEGLSAAAKAIVLGTRAEKRLHRSTAAILVLCAIGRVTIHADRARAVSRVERIRDAVRAQWNAGHLIVSPTQTFPAPAPGRVFWTRGMMPFAKLGNLCDATALSVPFGRYADGLPKALQVLGPPGSEQAVLDLGQEIGDTLPHFN